MILGPCLAPKKFFSSFSTVSGSCAHIVFPSHTSSSIAQHLTLACSPNKSKLIKAASKPNSGLMARIIIAEDDQGVNPLVKEALTEAYRGRHAVEAYWNTKDAYEAFGDGSGVACVVSDNACPDRNDGYRMLMMIKM